MVRGRGDVYLLHRATVADASRVDVLQVYRVLLVVGELVTTIKRVLHGGERKVGDRDAQGLEREDVVDVLADEVGVQPVGQYA